MQRITEVVPISADDLADWAVRLYDEYLDRPDLIRLATWARLERSPAGHLMGEDRIDAPKLAAIAAAQESGAFSDAVGAAEPFDVMAMVIAMSMAWSPVSNVYAATADEQQVPAGATAAPTRWCGRRSARPRADRRTSAQVRTLHVFADFAH